MYQSYPGVTGNCPLNKTAVSIYIRSVVIILKRPSRSCLLVVSQKERGVRRPAPFLSLSKLYIILPKFHMFLWSWEMQGYIECEKVTVGGTAYLELWECYYLCWTWAFLWGNCLESPTLPWITPHPGFVSNSILVCPWYSMCCVQTFTSTQEKFIATSKIDVQT